MKERPILFNSEMVKAILDDRKTQTRRIIKLQPPENSRVIYDSLDCYEGEGWAFQYPKQIAGGLYHNAIFELPQKGKCPYGQVGDRLYVREKWGYWGCTTGGDPEEHYKSVMYHADGVKRNIHFDTFKAMVDLGPHQNIKHKSDCVYEDYEMRWYCDCHSEWWQRKKIISSIYMPKWAARIWLEVTNIRVERVQDISEEDCVSEGIKHCVDLSKKTSDHFRFIVLWDSINNKRGFGWNKNPWVWVVEFKRIEN